jgi:hypothetical protein
VKITDRYDAKIELWARHPRVYPQPKMKGLPHFGHRKFSSWEEFNAWKREFLREIARRGGVTWTR